VTYRRFVPWLLASAMGVLLAGPAHAQSVPPNEIVISEFRTRGPAGGNDEFVELRDRSSQPVDISVHINSEFWSQISDHDSLVALLKLDGGGGGGGDDDIRPWGERRLNWLQISRLGESRLT